MPGPFELRRRGGMLEVNSSIDASLRQLARFVKEARAFNKAAYAVHQVQAEALQQDIVEALETAIDERGRQQRPEQLLLKAVRDRRFIQYNVDGWTVGGLDEEWAGRARLYYRNLEVGTRIFVGRTVPGYFLRPIEGGGGNMQQMGNEGPQGKLTYKFKFLKNQTYAQRGFNNKDLFVYAPYSGNRIKIQRPIVGYHYFRQGYSKFINSGGTGVRYLTQFRRALRAAGAPTMATALKGGGSTHTRSFTTMGNSFIDKKRGGFNG